MKWISIEKQIPKPFETTLVFCPTATLKIRICQFSDWKGAENLEITHWMHLPEPPEKKG